MSTESLTREHVPPVDALTVLKTLSNHDGFRVTFLTSASGQPSYYTDRLRDLTHNQPHPQWRCTGQTCFCWQITQIEGSLTLVVPQLSNGDDQQGIGCLVCCGQLFTPERAEASQPLSLLLRVVATTVYTTLKDAALNNWRLNTSEEKPQRLRVTSTTSNDQTQFLKCIALCHRTFDDVQTQPRATPGDVQATQLLFHLWGRPDDMTIDEIQRCTQHNLHQHQTLSTLLPPAKFLPLSDAFLEWLGEDGIYLDNDDNDVRSEDSGSTKTCESGHSTDLSLSDWLSTPEYPAFVDAINREIRALGGAVFPKLNWSSAKDATWMAVGRTLDCASARYASHRDIVDAFDREVLVVLKASAWITHDVDKAFSRVFEALPRAIHPDYWLCLKQWIPDIRDGSEFRVFFWAERVLGISQRDVHAAYDSLTDDAAYVATLRHMILQFFSETFYPTFLNLCAEDGAEARGAFDVYVLQASCSRDVTCKLLDVSPWGATTDPLLYSWEELRDRGLAETVASPPEFRIVQKDMAGKRRNPEDYQRLPQDFLDLCGNGTMELADDMIKKLEALTSTPSNSNAD